MTKLLFCVAIPRSGKSTYCKQWAAEKPNRVIVCADNIRLSLHNQRFNSYSEEFVSAIKHVMIRTLLKTGFSVIIDGTHTTPNSIKKIFEIDPNAEPVLFDTPVWLCQERAIATNQPDLLPVIDRMEAQLEKLQDGGFEKNLEEIRKQVVEYRVV